MRNELEERSRFFQAQLRDDLCVGAAEDMFCRRNVLLEKKAQPQDEGLREIGGQYHQQADAQKGTGVPCLQVCDGTGKNEKKQTCLRPAMKSQGVNLR